MFKNEDGAKGLIIKNGVTLPPPLPPPNCHSPEAFISTTLCCFFYLHSYLKYENVFQLYSGSYFFYWLLSVNDERLWHYHRDLPPHLHTRHLFLSSHIFPPPTPYTVMSVCLCVLVKWLYRDYIITTTSPSVVFWACHVM